MVKVLDDFMHICMIMTRLKFKFVVLLRTMHCCTSIIMRRAVDGVVGTNAFYYSFITVTIYEAQRSRSPPTTTGREIVVPALGAIAAALNVLQQYSFQLIAH